MENNLKALKESMRVDFVNQVNLVRPNLDDLTTEWNNFVEYFTRSYLDEWRGEGGSREDFDEFVEDMFNDIPNVLL